MMGMFTMSRASHLAFIVSAQVYCAILLQLGPFTFPASSALKLSCNPVDPAIADCEIGEQSCQNNPKDELVSTTPPHLKVADLTSSSIPQNHLDDSTKDSPLGASEVDESIGKIDREIKALYDFDLIDKVTDDFQSIDFYKPPDLESKNRSEAYAEHRKPFVQEVGYSVFDKVPLQSMRGYIQDFCECPGTDCEIGHEEPSPDQYVFYRHKELCFRKGRNESEHRSNVKRLEKVCDWNNDCSERYFTQPLCYNTVTKHGLSTAEKYGILFFHNLLRARRAEGSNVGRVRGRRRGVPVMMEMEWDATLADKAQRLVNSCEYNHDCSYCRNTGFVGNVGQILVSIIADDTSELDAALATMLRITRLTRSQSESFKDKRGSGMLGQMLWESTTRVGCGLVTFKLPDEELTREGVVGGEEAADGGGSPKPLWETLLACNYYPTGNEVDQPVLSQGPACSQCPSRTQCSIYSKVLCSRFYTWDMHDLHPEEAEQFFALTEEERRLRVKIVEIIFKSAENENDDW